MGKFFFICNRSLSFQRIFLSSLFFACRKFSGTRVELLQKVSTKREVALSNHAQVSPTEADIRLIHSQDFLCNTSYYNYYLSKAECVF